MLIKLPVPYVGAFSVITNLRMELFEALYLAAGEAEVGEGAGEVAEDNLVRVEVKVLQFQRSEL